jgi:hypothetical protein
MSAGKIGEPLELPLLSQASRLRLTRKFSIGNFRWFFNGDMVLLKSPSLTRSKYFLQEKLEKIDAGSANCGVGIARQYDGK